MLKEEFTAAVLSYNPNADLAERLWQEISAAHSSPQRHYHNLHHLENLLLQLQKFRNKITGWNCIVFAIAYHDFVYDTARGDNEEMSAEMAVKRLGDINVPAKEKDFCKTCTLATKTHTVSEENDINLFTDADLAILGAGWETYYTYTQQIRQEYGNHPMFNMGRSGVMQRFLKMKRIYKTEEFYTLYEKQARENISREIALLSS